MPGCSRFASSLLLGFVLLLAGGCASTDRHVFDSTPNRPATVALIDTLDGTVVWQLDVPPQHQLVLDLGRRGEMELTGVSGRPATHADWTLYDVGLADEDNQSAGRRTVSSERIDLDGRPVMIDVSYNPPAVRDTEAVEEEVDDELEPGADEPDADDADADETNVDAPGEADPQPAADDEPDDA